MKKIKLLLIFIPILSLCGLIATAILTSEPGQPPSDFSTICGLSMLFAPLIICTVLSITYAKHLNRSPFVWGLAAFFFPHFAPIILAFVKPLNKPSINRFETDNQNNQRIEDDITDDSIGQIQGFCEDCISETTDESPGNANTINGIGTMLMGTRFFQKGLNPCSKCHSVIQTKWFTIGFGVNPLGTYRILYTKKGIITDKYHGRRLKNDPYRR